MKYSHEKLTRDQIRERYHANGPNDFEKIGMSGFYAEIYEADSRESADVLVVENIYDAPLVEQSEIVGILREVGLIDDVDFSSIPYRSEDHIMLAAILGDRFKFALERY